MTGGGLLGMLDLSAQPELPAVIDEDASLSRGELLAAARERAELIRDRVPVGCRVALEDTRDADAIVNVVAALIAGRPVAMVPQESGIDLVRAAATGCTAVARGPHIQAIDLPVQELGTLDTRFGQDRIGSPETVVLFTSGTTSEPRGVRLSKANVSSNVGAMLRIVPPARHDERFGMVLALTHSFGLSMVLLSLARRVPVVMLGGGIPSRGVVDRCDRERVTVLACVPYYLRLLERRGLGLGTGFGRYVDMLLLAGGGITDSELDRLVPGFTGPRFLMYGFTEATARVAVRRAGDGSPPDSVGMPIPGASVEIVSPDGTPLPTGSEGCIRVTSPGLMMGYLGEELRPAGPFTTSDLGRVDAGGNLFVTGRQAEMLNFRGNRVSVVSVEAQVMKLDGVVDARLVPDPGDDDAQCTLYLVIDPGADRGGLRREALRVVAPRGLLRKVVFADHLETTRSGKPLRRRPQ